MKVVFLCRDGAVASYIAHELHADGFVDGNDFLIWQSSFGSTQTGTAASPDYSSVV